MFLAITSMRNEGPHCLEWVAHHLAAGFDHVLAFSNDCDDGTDEILDLLQEHGVLTHVPLTAVPGKSVQWEALKRAAKTELYRRATWAMVLDCDEFLALRTPLKTLPELVEHLPDETDAMAIAWRLFGNSGFIEMEDRPTTEGFLRAAPEDLSLPLGHFFKTLFRPEAFLRPGIHRPRSRDDRLAFWVDGSGRALPRSFAQADGRINLFGMPHGNALAQLNHYSLRSAQDFMVKRDRGLPNRRDKKIDLGYWVERNFNTVPDLTIAHMLPATRDILKELMALSGMARLHERAVDWHRNRFEQLMTEPDNVRLFGHLALAAGSTPPPGPIVARQLERLAAARQRDG